jgi:hypothetical protein
MGPVKYTRLELFLKKSAGDKKLNIVLILKWMMGTANAKMCC